MIRLPAVLLIAAVGVLVRWSISLGPHSGKGVPPMHGDFEAQRHWVEITWALPPQDWYQETADNNLQYWGLDYPPLSAWHAQLIGLTANKTLPLLLPPLKAASAFHDAFGLHHSRGDESHLTIRIMRLSSIATDAALYMAPCAALLLMLSSSKMRREGSLGRVLAAILLLLPAPQLLIDHGHFQFNAVPLGLCVLCVLYTLASPSAMPSTAVVAADVAFCVAGASAIMFKQMALYYAPAFAVHILMRVVMTTGARSVGLGLAHFCCCLFAGLAVIAACLAPPLIASDVLTRMFPFGRGLYEDKVASVWCAVSVVFKVQRFVTGPALVRLCTCCTAAAWLPAIVLYCRSFSEAKTGVMAAFRLSLLLTASALGFFLFSFQVHEKSILLPCTPLTLVAVLSLVGVEKNSRRVWLWCAVHGQLVACFSMYPLMLKDRIVGPYWAFAAVWSIFSLAIPLPRGFAFVRVISLLALGCAHCCSAFYVPPPHLPDVAALVVAIVSCGHCLALLGFVTYQLK